MVIVFSDRNVFGLASDLHCVSRFLINSVDISINIDNMLTSFNNFESSYSCALLMTPAMIPVRRN